MGKAIIGTLVLLAACGRFGFEDSAVSPDGAIADGLARITVERLGTVGGTVMGTNGFSCSTNSCTLVVPLGSPVWLRGVASTDAWFAGWTNVCGGNFSCEFDAVGDVTVGADFLATPNRMFVTSTKTDGAFGGLAGGDAICRARATAAGLTGTFIAYLSDSTTDASSRLVGSRGWVRIDGAPFADAPTAFSSGKIVFPPRLDEYGDDLGNDRVFTGTTAGARGPGVCVDWSSNLATDDGAATRTHYAYAAMSSSVVGCDQQARLLCVETGRNVSVQIHPDPAARLAFVSKTPWTPGNGRSTADGVCATESAAAGMTGTFLAALATSTESIESRFPPGKGYRRVDGVRLLRGAGIFSTDFLDVPADLDSLGGQVSSDYWTGALRWNTTSPATQNCGDWSNGTPLIDGETHDTADTDLRSSAKRLACSTPLPVLCMQQ